MSERVISERVTIVGSGLIGRSWAIAFARAGWQVVMWDPAEGAAEASLATIDHLLGDLAAEDLLQGRSVSEVRGLISAGRRLEAALAGGPLGAGERTGGCRGQAGALGAA